MTLISPFSNPFIFKKEKHSSSSFYKFILSSDSSWTTDMHTQSEDSNSKEEKSHETLEHYAESLEILEEKAPQSVGDANTRVKST